MSTAADCDQLGLAMLEDVKKAVSQAMGRRFGRLPRLSWALDSTTSTCVLAVTGQVPLGVPADQVPQVLAAWADALGLAPAEYQLPGSAEYCGTVGPVQVTVWGITDFGVWAEGSVTEDQD